MKTNVIFKSGLNLVCNDVDIWKYNTYLYIHNVTPSTCVELMNEALKNKWNCTAKDNSIHPKAIELMIPNDQIERFCTIS